MPKGVYEHKSLSEEHRNAISKAMKGCIPWNTGKLCPQLSEANKGNHNGKGYQHTEEEKEKISRAGWKGGRVLSQGYIRIYKRRQNKNTCTMEHRNVMAEFLNRPLTSEEVVHHENGNRADNRIENLKLFKNKGEHRIYHSKIKEQGGWRKFAQSAEKSKTNSL